MRQTRIDNEVYVNVVYKLNNFHLIILNHSVENKNVIESYTSIFHSSLRVWEILQLKTTFNQQQQKVILFNSKAVISTLKKIISPFSVNI